MVCQGIVPGIGYLTGGLVANNLFMNAFLPYNMAMHFLPPDHALRGTLVETEW